MHKSPLSVSAVGGSEGLGAWYVRGRPRLFREGGRSFYETLADHRRRLGVPVPTLEVG